MSLNDFYRIREKALASPTTLNNTSRSPPQSTAMNSSYINNNSFLQKAQEHKNRLLEYDKNNKQYNPLLTYESQKITDPYTIVDKNDDAIKDLNILCKYAKIATIRDR